MEPYDEVPDAAAETHEEAVTYPAPPPPYPTPEQRFKRLDAWLRTAAVVALVLAIGTTGFLFGHYVDRSSTSVVVPRYVEPSGGGVTLPSFPGFSGSNGGEGFPGVSPTPSPQDTAAEKIASKVDPGLIDINSNLSYEGGGAEGTGMVLTADGLAITNNHVVEGASSITAVDVGNGKTYQVKVLGYDVSADVAVIQLENASGLKTVTTGNSNDVTTGEDVVGVGNAGGVGGTPSYAAGTLTATDQSITASDEDNPSGAEHLSGLLETSAAIEPGDSGGPLVNDKGHVIGMDTAGSTSNGSGFGIEGGTSTTQGYAIPINTVLSIEKSIKDGDATDAIHVGATAFLGVEVDSAQQSTGVSTTNGVEIAEAIAGEPAALAGLVEGDVITSVNGTSVTTPTELQQEMLTLSPGQKVSVDYVSTSGVATSVTVTLGSGPAQ